MITDYLGNEIKEGMEVCNVIKTDTHWRCSNFYNVVTFEDELCLAIPIPNCICNLPMEIVERQWHYNKSMSFGIKGISIVPKTSVIQ